MRRKLGLVVVGLMVAGVGTIGSFVASSSSATAGTTLTVIEHYGKSSYSDLGKPGYSLGDVSTFHNKIYAEDNATRVGSDQGICTVISTKQHSWECVSTVFLEGGSITVETPFYDTEDSLGAITGGTGIYFGASGTIALSCTDGDCTSGEYTFVFTLA